MQAFDCSNVYTRYSNILPKMHSHAQLAAKAFDESHWVYLCNLSGGAVRENALCFFFYVRRNTVTEIPIDRCNIKSKTSIHATLTSLIKGRLWDVAFFIGQHSIV